MIRFIGTAVGYTCLFWFFAIIGDFLPTVFLQNTNLIITSATFVLPLLFILIVARRSHMHSFQSNSIALAGAIPISLCYTGYLWDFNYNMKHALMLFGKLSVQSSLLMFNISTSLMVISMMYFFLKLKKEN